MSSPSPLVSIIIPLYNHQAYIEAALKSVFNQTYPRLEIIVVDDGSEDGSLEIARDQVPCSPYPLHITRQSNQGAHAAINKGIEISTGQVIAILNSDDCFHEDRIRKMVHDMDVNQAEFAFSGVMHIDQAGNPLSDHNPYRHYYQKSLKHATFFPAPTFELIRHNFAISTGNFIFTRALFNEIGPFRAYETCHDWDYLLRVIRVEEPLFVKQELYQYRIHSENTLQKREDVRGREIVQVMEGYLQHMGEVDNPLAPSPALWGAYWSYFVRRYMNHFPEKGKIQKVRDLAGQDQTPPIKGRIGRMVEISFRILFGALRFWNQFPFPRLKVKGKQKARWAKTWTRFLSKIFPAGRDGE